MSKQQQRNQQKRSDKRRRTKAEKEADLLADLFKRRKVKLRDTEQVVEHEGYRFRTIVDPESFGIYEAAMKSWYIQRQIAHKMQEQWDKFTACMGRTRYILDKNEITLPWIAEKWGKPELEQAVKDYHACVRLLVAREGRDETSAEIRNLYYGLLD